MNMKLTTGRVLEAAATTARSGHPNGATAAAVNSTLQLDDESKLYLIFCGEKKECTAL